MHLSAIQAELRARHLDGWLFYDHHHRDPIAYRVLGLPAQMATRRWYYLIPAEGAPRKLVHRIEAGALDPLPGERRVYARWGELEAGLRGLVAELGAAPRLAMQYSPGCALPAISLADAGTVETMRQLGCLVLSSGDLISRFDATWTAAMLANHRLAGRGVDAAIAGAFAWVRQELEGGRRLDEYRLQRWLVEQMQAGGLEVEEPPIVAVNAHAGDPHYQPPEQGSAPIAPGDLLLLDVWAKAPGAESAYYDVTWMGYCARPGEGAVPEEYAQAFAVARAARDAGIACVAERLAAGQKLRGYEVDRAVRGVIAAAGLGEYFVHRTGHSLGREVHATGANLDDFETHDEREILVGSGFTIEPGIYCPQGKPYGVRTEVNLYVGEGGAEVTGPRQQEIVRI
ncbi:MAG TPA: M24 family metallopeptidase [Terriglobales bacterium]|nr:M24 family metallopeptidase [Terriglobales bacterium]